MSDQPEPAMSAELKAWLQAAIADSIPKALAAFRNQTATTATITQLSNSDDSRVSDHDKAPCKCPWKGDSASAGKGKAPAKTAKLSHAKPTLTKEFDPLKGSASGYHLQMMDDYDAYPDEDLPRDPSSSEFVTETFLLPKDQH
ncbi:Hypothetical predicted protein [Pelobates cultripes]|uniref:Uncharacterized protein n=1 Tax=Pelobates cultripes TaxID=61616 RepID=A0AAD1RXB7_PELCU|nr:Hypothetical predicted protein [Pelobates cultripes]